MAITTYAELKTAIATWLARDDLTDTIPDFIMLFEKFVARRLKSRGMTATTMLFTDDGEAALPTDYVSMTRLTWYGSTRRELRGVSSTELDSLYPDTTPGVPAVFSVEGATIRVRPVDDDTELELVYLRGITPLATESNWLFEKYPDLYLFGSLVEAEVFNKDAEKATIWKSRRDEIMAEIDRMDFNERPRMAVSHVGVSP